MDLINNLILAVVLLLVVLPVVVVLVGAAIDLIHVEWQAMWVRRELRPVLGRNPTPVEIYLELVKRWREREDKQRDKDG